MKRFFITVFILAGFIIIVHAPLAGAQGDAITVAIAVIEDFSEESYSVVKAIDRETSYNNASSMDREKTLAELETLNWVHKPGARRFMRIYSIVSSYFEGEIARIKSFISEARPQDGESLETIHRELDAIKNEKFRLLLASIKSETYERKPKGPVPVIDSSPFEHEPDDATGLWYR